MDHLPPKLRELVHQSVEMLGQVIAHEMGDKAFQLVEAVRSEMAALRPLDRDAAFPVLKNRLDKLRE